MGNDYVLIYINIDNKGTKPFEKFSCTVDLCQRILSTFHEFQNTFLRHYSITCSQQGGFLVLYDFGTPVYCFCLQLHFNKTTSAIVKQEENERVNVVLLEKVQHQLKSNFLFGI